jgi:flavin reductase (DIM6/NTAB) family NADH-FMN oxidoreductase RutF
VTHDAFREALGAFATGIVLVTTRGCDGTPYGLIVSSFTSVSLDPPLVAFCPSTDSMTWRRMRTAGRIGVNVLAHEHAAYARAAAAPGANRFAGVDHDETATGTPRLEGALAFLECRLEDEHRAGDHWIVVARVETAEADRRRRPLVNWASAFRGLAA